MTFILSNLLPYVEPEVSKISLILSDFNEKFRRLLKECMHVLSKFSDIFLYISK